MWVFNTPLVGMAMVDGMGVSSVCGCTGFGLCPKLLGAMVVGTTSIEDTFRSIESLRRCGVLPGILLFLRERALAYEFVLRVFIHVGSCSSITEYLHLRDGFVLQDFDNHLLDRCAKLEDGFLLKDIRFIVVTPSTCLMVIIKSPGLALGLSRAEAAPDPSTHDDPSVNKIHGSWSFTSLWGSTASVSGFSMRKSASICPLQLLGNDLSADSGIGTCSQTGILPIYRLDYSSCAVKEVGCGPLSPRTRYYQSLVGWHRILLGQKESLYSNRTLTCVRWLSFPRLPRHLDFGGTALYGSQEALEGVSEVHAHPPTTIALFDHNWVGEPGHGNRLLPASRVYVPPSKNGLSALWCLPAFFWPYWGSILVGFSTCGSVIDVGTPVMYFVSPCIDIGFRCKCAHTAAPTRSVSDHPMILLARVIGMNRDLQVLRCGGVVEVTNSASTGNFSFPWDEDGYALYAEDPGLPIMHCMAMVI
ncbi:hypothetical protein Tco_1376065 [Tanacetum coccineum]